VKATADAGDRPSAEPASDFPVFTAGGDTRSRNSRNSSVPQSLLGASAVDVPILTPDQRVRVFVSSTLSELAAERAAVRRAVERLQLVPVMFELGGAAASASAAVSRVSDAEPRVSGDLWERYGWVAPDEDVSGLEDEYRLCGDLPRLVYVSGAVGVPPGGEPVDVRNQADELAATYVEGNQPVSETGPHRME
jgi:Domain of unknown function (DUF4062)